MTSRRFGILSLLAAVCWTLAVAMVITGVAVGIYSALLGASAVLTPSPTDERDARIAVAVLVTAVVGTAALALLTIVLDLAVIVMSVRRLGGPEHARAVPLLCLVAVGASSVLPVLLLSLALLAGALEMREVAAALWWLLAGTVVGLAPWTRLAQLIGGIVETATAPARSRRPRVGPLP